MRKTLTLTFALAAAAALAAPTVSYRTATNIAEKVVEEKVTKEFVEALGVKGEDPRFAFVDLGEGVETAELEDRTLVSCASSSGLMVASLPLGKPDRIVTCALRLDCSGCPGATTVLFMRLGSGKIEKLTDTSVPAGKVAYFGFACRRAAGKDDWTVERKLVGGEPQPPANLGAARALPKYLHRLCLDDTYSEDAAWSYEQADGALAGGCSARRSGALFERNYDWSYDESASFVLSVGSSRDRFASVGVASAGTHLTEEFVTSGQWSRWYKALPGRTLDGINENGVAAEINVVATNGSPWETKGTRDLNAIGAVRWVLDHATSAGLAAQELAKRVYIPESMKRLGYSAHFLIADAATTYVVEDGRVIYCRGSAVMTNYRLNVQDDPYGTGYERAAILAAGGSITNAWFREAYRRPFARPTEFAAPGVGTHDETEKLVAWAEANVPAGAPESLKRTGLSWQTVHTSVYDLGAKTLKVAVQETDDWYVFALPPKTDLGDYYTKDETDAAIAGAWDRDDFCGRALDWACDNLWYDDYFRGHALDWACDNLWFDERFRGHALDWACDNLWFDERFREYADDWLLCKGIVGHKFMWYDIEGDHTVTLKLANGETIRGADERRVYSDVVSVTIDGARVDYYNVNGKGQYGVTTTAGFYLVDGYGIYCGAELQAGMAGVFDGQPPYTFKLASDTFLGIQDD